MRKIWLFLILFFVTLNSLIVSSAQPVITINHHTIPENPSVGYFILSIDLSNAGTNAKNIEMQINENERDFALIDDNKKVSGLYMDLGDLSAGATSASFKVFADKSGIYQINVKIKYRYFINNTGYQGSINKVIAIVVSEKPNFIVDANISIKPSETKQFPIKIKNVGGKAKDVRINFETPENVVCDANLAFDVWNANEEKEVSIKLLADKKAEVGMYKLNLKISYTDEFGDKNVETIPVAMEIYGIPKLVLAGFSTNPERIYPDSEFVLNIQIENIGNDKAKNVVCKLTIPKGFEGRDSYFIGSLESGDSATATFELRAGNSGKQDVRAIIYYMDSKFEKYGVTKELTLYVFPRSYSEVYAIVAFLIALVIFYYWNRRRKGKK